MCIVCVELIKQKMTLREAESNLREIASDDAHMNKLLEAIEELDLETLAEELDAE